jgi:Cu(I)/Ag(I) efflux system membrane protein CusA/SilA
VHGTNTSELDVDFHSTGRARKEVLAEIREKLSSIEGVRTNIGQPLSHRIDHMLSGINAQIAIKLFGPDLSTLRRYAHKISNAIEDVPGLVDLQVESQTTIPETKIYVLREEAARKGIVVGELTKGLETALHGATVGQIIENQRTTDVIVQFDTDSRADLGGIADLPIRILPNGEQVKLSEVADIYSTKGPNMIQREEQRRRIVIQANASDRDVGSIVKEIQQIIDEKLELPEGYFVTYDGQFESQQRATRHILLLSILALVAIFVILWGHFASAWFSAQVILSLPFAMIGGLFALFLGDRTLSIASLIGFVTLCGIASRNTIMMLSHYIHLIKEEGNPLNKETVIRGSQERLIPVLMTSLTAIFGLLPLALAAGEAGKEILHPLAVVIIGGLITSTLLDVLLTPIIFYNFGRAATLRALENKEQT